MRELNRKKGIRIGNCGFRQDKPENQYLPAHIDFLPKELPEEKCGHKERVGV